MTKRQENNGHVISCVMAVQSNQSSSFSLADSGFETSALRGENDFKEQQGKERGEEGGLGSLGVTKQLTRTDNT